VETVDKQLASELLVSTAGEIAIMLRAQLEAGRLPESLGKELLRGVESNWAQSDRYGLGMGEMTALTGRHRSPCAPAWGHATGQLDWDLYCA
jgi:hypothetical protein